MSWALTSWYDTIMANEFQTVTAAELKPGMKIRRLWKGRPSDDQVETVIKVDVYKPVPDCMVFMTNRTWRRFASNTSPYQLITNSDEPQKTAVGGPVSGRMTFD